MIYKNPIEYNIKKNHRLILDRSSLTVLIRIFIYSDLETVLSIILSVIS
jgi:hypothetical protein